MIDGIDSLRMQARQDPDAALKGAAKQFEALFMQMLLKSMRDALPQSETSEATRTYTGMLDQQLAQTLSGKGFGFAEMMVKQLSKEKPSMEHTGDFTGEMLPHAEAAESATGVPARFILGQAALESGWGKREIPGSHNLFGIKAGPGWNGPTASAATTEYVGGEPRQVTEKFRAYGSYAESFRDWARLVADNPRYAEALKPGNDAGAFAEGLARGGYATDPDYAAKLARAIRSVE